MQGHGDAPAELVYFAFDLPHPDGEDKVRLPLLERKGCFSLEVLLSGAPAVIRFGGHVIGNGAHVFEAGSKLGVDVELADQASTARAPIADRIRRKSYAQARLWRSTTPIRACLCGGILEHKSGRDIRALNREVAQQMLLRR